MSKMSSSDSLNYHASDSSSGCDQPNTHQSEAEADKNEPRLGPVYEKKVPPSYNLEGWKQVIIFNQYKFDSRFEVSNRDGTEYDVESIKNTFESIGWNVEVYNDLTVAGIRKVMEDMSDVECSALAIFILSHGESNNIIMAADSYYNLKGTIFDPLMPDNCPGLKEKPKLIFIQACQGSETDPGTPSAKRRKHTSSDSTDSGTFKIPTPQDFFIARASYHDFVSFRNPKTGSWFIQELCSAIDESDESESIDDVLITTRREVANKESSVPLYQDRNEKKQIPPAESTLIYKLYLKKGIDHSSTYNGVEKLMKPNSGKEQTEKSHQTSCMCM